MSDEFLTSEEASGRPLPLPTLERWQPLRLGLVELFYYDSEEFWFKDGHLLLRGNNGTGKSKVLSLTMPLLLDAQLKPSRVEPDGDPTKRMGWNLLLGSMDRRIGYTWIEFGRVSADGVHHYLTLGAGLSAVAARPRVDGWFFVLEGEGSGPRVNQDLWLTNKDRVVLTKEKLKEQLQGRGLVFETAEAYRRAVDERLFGLGQRRYDALIDTLIQLRQPQLSKKPDEELLSAALSEALPPIRTELLAEVADALGQLEDDRHQLEQFESLLRAVDRFDRQYRTYAGTQARRQARGLRQAQTEFERASRQRSDAQDTLREASESLKEKEEAEGNADIELKAERARRDVLQSHPTMQDANRLENAQKDADSRRTAANDAKEFAAEAGRRLQTEKAEADRAKQRLTSAQRALDTQRADGARVASNAALTEGFAANSLVSSTVDELLEVTQKQVDAFQAQLRQLVSDRRDGIKRIRALLSDVERADSAHSHQQTIHSDAIDAADQANERRVQADEEFEQVGASLVEAWTSHYAGLKELQPETEALERLAEWVVDLAGDNPAGQALAQAQQDANRRLADRQAQLGITVTAARKEVAQLEAERTHLQGGVDPEPDVPTYRDVEARASKAGAPLWRLVDFAEDVQEHHRAGLEAALQASGILDAWVSPTGEVQLASGLSLNDEDLFERPAASAPLSAWLTPSLPPDCLVPAQTVSRLLEGISCSEDDRGDGQLAESWVSPIGAYRLGSVAGRWQKEAAEFIGAGARAAARARRLEEISERLLALDGELEALAAQARELKSAGERIKAEWATAPGDGPLRQASVACSAAAREASASRAKLLQAEEALKIALGKLEEARKRLVDDATDLHLPSVAVELEGVATALDEFQDKASKLHQAVLELRLAAPSFETQSAREQQAAEDHAKAEERLTAAEAEARAALTVYETLRDSVGTKVEALLAQLADSRKAVEAKEKTHKDASSAVRTAGEIRAVAQAAANTAETTLDRVTADRAAKVTQLQKFAASGLLEAGAPELAVPDMSVAWTVDPALGLARRLEQALTSLKDDEETWNRLLRHIGEDYSELQRALSAIGFQALAEQTDFGLAVTIIYQNRQERPDKLSLRLVQEIEERKEMLSAKEREILENHLQAEIAAEVQRLLRFADEHVIAINAELHKRPTSTGVRFKLDWVARTEQDGAPIGLDAARKRLLNVSSDLWSKEDRQVVGAMLQQRITAERERADAGGAKENAGGLQEQLARALDYRQWHRFNVLRLTPRGWAKLSGPASSGERALGLTVPLFAAVASFYGDSAQAICPRLILLDEVFAGIDDAARAHCWGIIREFDLDFIITSEREWACSSELPGVSICQLLKKEGIDAVLVSRWEWDGRAKRQRPDPNRRFGQNP